MDKRRLEQTEQYVLGFFQTAGRPRVAAPELFDSTAEFANADLVRALEHLEKRQRLLVRYTSEGNDYISLTPEGAKYIGLEAADDQNAIAMPHPPRSATDKLT
jgi:hypothetical protein